MDTLEELRYLVLAAQREGSRALAAALKDQELTPSQAEALSTLRTAATPLTVKAVGERLVCETGSPSRLMKTLIGKGLVEASHDDADGRVTRLRLTPAGAKAAAGVARAEQALYTVMAAAISRRDAKAACELLRSIVGELPTGRALARRIADGAS